MFNFSIKKMILFLFLIALGSTPSLTRGEEPKEPTNFKSLEGVQSVQVIKELDLVILHLNNGLTVCLKSTEDDDDEVIVRLTALGGHSTLPASQRASGQLAPKIALKSGMGEYNYDQFQALLYKHSIEFRSTVQPFCRVLEATSDPEEVEVLFSLVHLFFSGRKFTRDAYERVVAKALYNLKHHPKEGYRNFEEVFLSFNTQNFSPLQPLTKVDIERADYDTAKQFLEKSFDNPSDFICIIVGNIDPEAITPLIAKHLASIPKKESSFAVHIDPLPTSKQPKETKIIRNYNDSAGAITRLTFPLKGNVTENNMHALEAIARLVEVRLKIEIRKHLKEEQVEINTSLEFPLFPSLESPWLTVQYISDTDQVKPIEKIILSELKHLKKNGVSKEEVAFLKKNTEERMRRYRQDNSYWVMVLSNYYLWKWDPKGIQEKLDKAPSFEIDDLSGQLRSCLSLDRYTVVSAQP